MAEAIRRHLVALDAEHSGDDVALALAWTGLPAYRRLRAFARGVRDGLAERIDEGRPVYLMLDGDVAMTLGRLLRDELGVADPLLVVDGLQPARLRLHRHRPGAAPVAHGAGDHQVAAVQRGPARFSQSPGISTHSRM